MGAKEIDVNVADVRRKARRRIDRLSPERIQSADDFLAYLEECESNDATEEPLAIPGFREALKRGQEEAAAGRVKDMNEIKWKPGV